MRLSQLRSRRHEVVTSGKPSRKTPAKTLYELLGTRPDADAKTLHRAFRDAAKEHHPDHNPGDQDANRRFTQIVSAYEVLRNAEHRDFYDQLLADERERRRARLMRTVFDAVGVVSLTEARSSTLIGVFISVTTIPAASDIGVSLAFGNGSEAWGSALQLLLNVAVLALVAIAVESTIDVIAQLRKYIQPATYAAFSPRNSRAYDTNDPEDGRCRTSSPRARRIRKTKTPQNA